MVEASLVINANIILGAGNFATVYRGKFNDKDVAMKTVSKYHFSEFETGEHNEREENVLKLLNHENVIKLFHVQNDKHFRIFVLELCETSLDRLFLANDDPRKYKAQVPFDMDILLQFSKGLQYVHNYLTHGDIKPTNVLLTIEKAITRVKIGDFAFSTPVSVENILPNTLTYVAPELLPLKERLSTMSHNALSEDDKKTFKALILEMRASTKSDVFSAGCVFYYVLSKGKHPFNGSIDKIKAGQTDMLKVLPGQPLLVTIKKMIAHNPKDRLTMAQVTAVLDTKQVASSPGG